MAATDTDQFANPQHLRAVLETMLDGLMIVDAQGIVRVFNRACETLFGYDAGEIIGQNVKLLVGEEHRDSHDAYIQRFLDEGQPDILGRPREVSGARKDGSTVPVSVTLGQANVDGEVYFIAVVRDLTQELRLRRDAAIDPLTGVSNRRNFLARGRDELGRAVRYSRPCSVLMLDIDHFKAVNDTHGHAAGDEALRRFAEACQAMLRDSDVIARIGGEEFAVILPETDTQGAKILAERLREGVSRIRVPNGAGGFGFTVSIGIADRIGDDDDIESILARADSAMYRAKEAGRDQVAVAA